MVAVLPDRWELWVNNAAHKEVLEIRDNCPSLWARLLSEMSRLATMHDPRDGRNVKPLRYDAKGWYRLAIYDRQYRIVFRLLVDVGNGLFELHPGERIPPRSDQQGIEITRVSHREDVYDNELRLRRRRIL